MQHRRERSKWRSGDAVAHRIRPVDRVWAWHRYRNLHIHRNLHLQHGLIARWRTTTCRDLLDEWVTTHYTMDRN